MRRLEGNLTANKVSLALEALESLDAVYANVGADAKPY